MQIDSRRQRKSLLTFAQTSKQEVERESTDKSSSGKKEAVQDYEKTSNRLMEKKSQVDEARSTLGSYNR